MTKSKKRIAIICGDVTAALNRRPEFCQSISKLAEEAFFFCPPCEQEQKNQIENMGFKLRTLANDKQSMNPLGDVGYCAALRQLLKNYNVTDVFAFHLKPIMYGGIICRSLKIRFHCLFAGLGFLYSSDSSLKKSLVQRIVSSVLSQSLKKASTIFFQNRDDHETMKQHGVVGDWNQNIIVVNGSGINLETFAYDQPRMDPPIKFLLVARMLRDKGIPEFYQSAKALKLQWGDKAEFQLLGPFDDNPNAMDPDQIRAWDQEGILRYLGTTSDIRPYIRDSSVVVLPSFYMEGTPKVLLESLAIGRAIVTTNSRGCRETTVDRINGFIVEPRSISELTDAMENFLKDPTLILQMGMASRELAKTKFDVRQVNETMLEAMHIQVKEDIRDRESS